MGWRLLRFNVQKSDNPSKRFSFLYVDELLDSTVGNVRMQNQRGLVHFCGVLIFVA